MSTQTKQTNQIANNTILNTDPLIGDDTVQFVRPTAKHHKIILKQ